MNHPKSVVILGANGFIGSNISKNIDSRRYNVVNITRNEINLTAPEAAKSLAKITPNTDVMVIAAAVAPVKTYSMLAENIAMQKNICDALACSLPKHIIYISSDAVYSDSKNPLDETSPTNPDSLHGTMHLAREKMLVSLSPQILTIFRPTLVFGYGDPHNGYGPNRFIRQASKGEPISLFGHGEELRDHIHIRDVASTVVEAIENETGGVFNLVSGKTTSFRDIANLIERRFNNTKILSIPRSGPMPHGGYRAFNNAKLKENFERFNPIDVSKWILEEHTSLR